MSEKVSITKSKLDSLANAIASVGETSVPKTIAQMESAVLELTIPPNLQSKTITPSVTQQIVSPDSGYDGFSSVTVNAIELQEKTVTPTTEQQIVTPDSIEYTCELSEGLQQDGAGTSSMYFIENTITQQSDYFIVGTSYKTEGEVTLSTGTVITFGYTDIATSTQQGATTTATLKPTYNYTGPTTISNLAISKITKTAVYLIIEYTGVTEAPTGIITKEVQIYEDGQTNYDGLSKVTVNAMPSGTAGMPVASKGTVSNHSVSITPSVINTTGYITGGAKMGTAVTVNVAELESGTKSITENGTGISVSGYSTVDVAVQAGTIIDDGDGNINLSPTGEVAVITPLAVNQNGTYTASGVNGYSPVTVNVESSAAGGKDVNFIDYDGTVLYSYTATEAQALTELPANPSHARLTAQGWNWTLAQIKNQLTNVGGKVWVGQMYTTKSGATEIDIELDNPDYLSPYLAIAINGTVSIDWGDGTATSTATGTSAYSLIYTLHEYAAIGNYTIKIFVVSGSFTFYNESSVKPAILFADGSNSNKGYSRAYAETVKRIFIGDDARIGGLAFQQCYFLQSITIPNSVTSIGANAFYNCYSLQSVTIPSGVTSIENYTFYISYSLQSIAIPSSVTSIGNNAFCKCLSLQSITIPNGVTSIRYIAFRSCYSLQSVIIPSNVTSIEYNAFADCYSLQNVTISSGVTSIGNEVFYNCYSLQNIIIPSSVTSIGYRVFYNCYSLQNIIIPSSVTSIGYYTFSGCNSLKNITIPDGVTSIQSNTFNGCYSLQNVTIPDEVTSIAGDAFSSCYSLKNITIPDGVTSIQSNTFQYCYSLQNVTIPDGVTSIGANAFNGCYGVEEYHITSTTPPTLSNTNAFSGIMPGTIIYVPSESLDAYKTASNWSTYASYMQGE